MTEGQVLNYLLACIVAQGTDKSPADVLQEAKDYWNRESPNARGKIVSQKDVDLVYNAYPSHCPINGRSTAKGSKDREKIKELLKTHSPEEILQRMSAYLNDCRKTDTYIKNFSTFLNNIPDPTYDMGILLDQSEEPIRQS